MSSCQLKNRLVGKIQLAVLESAEYPPKIRRIMSRRKSAAKNAAGRKSAEKLDQPAANAKNIRLAGLDTDRFDLKTASAGPRHAETKYREPYVACLSYTSPGTLPAAYLMLNVWGS